MKIFPLSPYFVLPHIRYPSCLRSQSKLTTNLKALDFLYQTYWLPLLSPLPAAPLPPLAPLRILLAGYKSLTKQSLRDQSKRSQLKIELGKIYHGIERWMGDVERAELFSIGVGGGGTGKRGKERAMEGVVEALLEIGGLVPTAKKYSLPPPASPINADNQ